METQRIVRSELRPHERLVWSGSPRPGRLARQALPVMLFAVPWTAFSLFWMYAATGFGEHLEWPMLLFSLFGLPFVGVGVALLTSPYRAYRRASATLYAVTNERALIFEPRGGGAMDVRSFPIAELGALRRVQRADGSGDLFFAAHTYTLKGRQRSTDIGFLGVPDVRRVEELMQGLR